MGKMGMGMGGDIVDEAEAVGDPHLTTASGEKADLCCENGECHACSEPPALLEEDADESEDQMPVCRTGILQNNICYPAQCGSTGQRPGGRNCAALPGGANACCMSRIQRFCLAPAMDRCKVRARDQAMGMGKMGMGKMGMGKMGMGKMGMGMGGDIVDEAEAVGDPHLTTASGEKADLCCENGECHACSEPPALLEEDADEDQMPV